MTPHPPSALVDVDAEPSTKEAFLFVVLGCWWSSDERSLAATGSFFVDILIMADMARRKVQRPQQCNALSAEGPSERASVCSCDYVAKNRSLTLREHIFQ